MADSSKPATTTEPAQDVPSSAAAPTLDQPKDAVPMTEMPKAVETQADQPAAAADAASSSNPVDATSTPDAPSDPASATAAATTAKQDDSIEPSASSAPAPPAKTDGDDSMAIGPSVENVQSVLPSDGLVCNITLLLTTGARHPYRIDEKYLTKRNVTVPGKTEEGKVDPFTISVYTLKELILREWREEWDAKPASPSSIRLIHFGKLLDDKDQLKQYHFSADAANVVHMTVRPADLIEEEEPKGGSKSGAGGRNRSGGGGCCVIF